MRLLLIWILNALALLTVANFVPGIRLDSFTDAMIAAFFLGLVNTLIRPLLLLLTLPVTLLTLGLFIFVINALLFQFAAAIVPGMHVDSFWSALFASIVVSIVSWILNSAIAGGAGEKTVIVRRGSGTIDMRRSGDGKWE